MCCTHLDTSRCTYGNACGNASRCLNLTNSQLQAACPLAVLFVIDHLVCHGVVMGCKVVLFTALSCLPLYTWFSCELCWDCLRCARDIINDRHGVIREGWRANVMGSKTWTSTWEMTR